MPIFYLNCYQCQMCSVRLVQFEQSHGMIYYDKYLLKLQNISLLSALRAGLFLLLIIAFNTSNKANFLAHPSQSHVAKP
jgi:hypothetical protein